MGGLFNLIAESSGRRATYSIPPSYMPKGRQFGVRSAAMAAVMAASSAPSGAVPGGGEAQPERKLWTRWRFSFLV